MYTLLYLHQQKAIQSITDPLQIDTKHIETRFVKMSGDKNGNKNISPNKIFKLDESDEDKDYLANRRRYYLLEQLSGTSTGKILPTAANAIVGHKVDSVSNIHKCTKEAISPSTTASTFLPFAGLRPFYPIHPSSYPYSLLSSSDVSQFSPW